MIKLIQTKGIASLVCYNNLGCIDYMASSTSNISPPFYLDWGIHIKVIGEWAWHNWALRRRTALALYTEKPPSFCACCGQHSEESR